VFDPDTIRGELAKSYSISPDNKVITITLRPDATWQDGTPVTAEDVKWSLDRAVSAKSLAAPQFTTGSLTKPEQFQIVDAQTITVTLDKPDRLALANLCVPYAIMINSKLAKKNATAEDPWAQEWMKANTAASGAYIVESHKAGESTVLRRNEKWVGGPGGALPSFRRIIIQTVPEPATRANLVERGDADLSIDLAAADLPTIEKSARAKLVSMPQTNGFTHVSMNTQLAPFDNVKVRKAVAAALPYDDMFKAAIFERGRKLYGADWTTPPNASFPEPIPYKTDPALAKKLLDDLRLQCRCGGDGRAPGGAAQGIAGQGRHPGGDPEEAGCRVQHTGVRAQDAVLRRRRDRLVALHLLLLLSLLHARAALELLLVQEHQDGGADAGCALPDRQGKVRRRLPEDDRDLCRRDAAHHAVAAQPRRRHGEVGRRLHLSVLPSGRFPRPEEGVACWPASPDESAAGCWRRSPRCSAW
jgi:hypothetical protein